MRVRTGRAGGRGWLAAAAALLLGGCLPYTPATLRPPADAPAPPAAPVAAIAPDGRRAPVTILVSLDGFRPDYLDRGITPRLSALAAEGVSAAMRPSFPSITFPNHWTLVTGLRPDRTGIVGNTMEDPARPGQTFTMQTDDPWWWNAAEPIWVTAERAGIRTATMFWPGANVAWGGRRTGDHVSPIEGGVRPEDWQHYDGAVTEQQRVAAVIDWLRRPADVRPRFITLYFERVDSAGHAYGPSDPRMNANIARVDAAIGLLVDQLRALGQPANLVVVADHGMADVPADHLIPFDQVADPADYHLVEAGAYAALAPVPGHEAALAAALLRPHPHLQCWPKADIPARLHFGSNPRVEPYLCLADVGWKVVRTAPKTAEMGGEHGYDNDAPEMRALFVADGPAFARGLRLATFDNVDVNPLLRDLLGLPTGTGLDGNDAPFRRALVQP